MPARLRRLGGGVVVLKDPDNDGEEEGENDGRGVLVQLHTRKDSDGAMDDSGGPETSASNTRAVDRFWLGQEPNLFDVAKEKQGVADILAALSGEEREQVQRDDTSMPIRHFRAEKGNTEKAIEKLRATLQWRKDVGVNGIVGAMMMQQPQDGAENGVLRAALLQDFQTGRLYVRGRDREGRALVVGHTHRPAYRNDAYTFCNVIGTMEKAIAVSARNGREKVVFVVDYRGFVRKDAIPFKLSKRVIDMVQAHYPERLHRIYIVDAPTVFRITWTLLRPFLDPVTKQKIVFCNVNDVGQFTKTVSDVHKLEDFAGGTELVRHFDAEEYMTLPFDIGFDE